MLLDLLWHLCLFPFKLVNNWNLSPTGRKVEVTKLHQENNPRIWGMFSDIWRRHSGDTVISFCLPCVAQWLTLGPVKRRIVSDKQHLLCVREKERETIPEKHLLPLWPVNTSCGPFRHAVWFPCTVNTHKYSSRININTGRKRFLTWGTYTVYQREVKVD